MVCLKLVFENANLKFFGAPGRQQPNIDGLIYIRYATPHYSPRISAFISSHLAKFGWVPLPCATSGNETERKIYGGRVESLVLFLPFCWPQFTKFSADVEALRTS